MPFVLSVCAHSLRMTECVIIDLYSPLSSQNELTFYSHSNPAYFLSRQNLPHTRIRVKMFAVILRVSTTVIFLSSWKWNKTKKMMMIAELRGACSRAREISRDGKSFRVLRKPTPPNRKSVWLIFSKHAVSLSLCLSHFLAFYLGGWARMNMSGCRFPIWDKLSPLFRGLRSLFAFQSNFIILWRGEY